MRCRCLPSASRPGDRGIASRPRQLMTATDHDAAPGSSRSRKRPTAPSSSSTAVSSGEADHELGEAGDRARPTPAASGGVRRPRRTPSEPTTTASADHPEEVAPGAQTAGGHRATLLAMRSPRVGALGVAGVAGAPGGLRLGRPAHPRPLTAAARARREPPGQGSACATAARTHTAPGSSWSPNARYRDSNELFEAEHRLLQPPPLERGGRGHRAPSTPPTRRVTSCGVTYANAGRRADRHRDLRRSAQPSGASWRSPTRCSTTPR